MNYLLSPILNTANIKIYQKSGENKYIFCPQKGRIKMAYTKLKNI